MTKSRIIQEMCLLTCLWGVVLVTVNWCVEAHLYCRRYHPLVCVSCTVWSEKTGREFLGMYSPFFVPDCGCVWAVAPNSCCLSSLSGWTALLPEGGARIALSPLSCFSWAVLSQQLEKKLRCPVIKIMPLKTYSVKLTPNEIVMQRQMEIPFCLTFVNVIIYKGHKLYLLVKLTKKENHLQCICL